MGCNSSSVAPDANPAVATEHTFKKKPLSLQKKVAGEQSNGQSSHDGDQSDSTASKSSHWKRRDRRRRNRTADGEPTDSDSEKSGRRKHKKDSLPPGLRHAAAEIGRKRTLPPLNMKPRSNSGDASSFSNRRKSRASIILQSRLQESKGMAGRANRTAEGTLMGLSSQNLHNLSRQQMLMLWREFDNDGNGRLDRKEMKLLSQACVDRTLKQMREELRRTNPDMSDKNLQKKFEKERQYYMPGKTMSEARKNMVRRLMKILDIDGDGNVTQAEFFMKWAKFSDEVFAVRDDGKADVGGGCVVM